MASAQQLIGLVKSHAEGDQARFFDLAMQLAAAEAEKGHTRLAEQLRQWAHAATTPEPGHKSGPTPLVTPRGDLAAILSASYPKTRMADLVIPTGIHDELHGVLTEKRHAERLEEKGLRPRTRLLLAGPPGTGKTLSASALAGELQYPLFTVLLHGLITKFMGETAQKLRLIFDAIRTTRGVYLFDEIDALAGARDNENDVGEARRILNSFLQFLDENTGPSIVVATTNIPKLLDRAVLRRFDLVLKYELPSQAEIEIAMKRRLRSFDVENLAWKKITECAAGLSTADVVAAGEDAARRAVVVHSVKIETAALLASLQRRRTLQGLGGELNAKRPPSHSPTKPRAGTKISGGRRRRNKSTSE